MSIERVQIAAWSLLRLAFCGGGPTFAGKQRYRLQLAEGQDLRSWCQHAAQEQVSARNRALALDLMLPWMQELRGAVTPPRLLVGGRKAPSFFVVVREIRTSALLARIPSALFSGDMHRGQRVPVLDGSVIADPFDGSKVFRAQRFERDGRVSYWGHRTLYWQWDGSPQRYDMWD